MSVTVASLGSGMRAAKTRQKRRRQLQPHCEKIDRGTKNRHQKIKMKSFFGSGMVQFGGPFRAQKVDLILGPALCD